MRKLFRFVCFIILNFIVLGSRAQWIPAAGMDGAPCQQLYLVDSVLVTWSSPSGIATRHVDSAYWPHYDHMDMMGYTVAGNYIISFLYNYFFRSVDYGATWDTLIFDNLSPIDLTSLDTLLFILEYPRGIMRSTDYGTTWDSLGLPAPGSGLGNLFSHDSSLFYIDDTTTAIYQSTDKGNSWISLPLTGLPPELLPWFFDVCQFGGTWWLTPANGSDHIYKFSMANQSWTCIADTISIDHFAVLTNVLYGYGSGIWQLNANGNKWVKKSDGLFCTTVTGMASIDTLFFCASNDGPFRAGDDFSWQPFMTGLYGGYVQCISTLGDEVWIGLNDDLYYSSDAGTSFARVENSPTNRSLVKMLMTDSIFYLKDFVSFYISTDYGNSWSEEMEGLTCNPPWQFTDFSVGDQYLFAACENRLYRSTSSPVFWEPAPIPAFNKMRTLQAVNSTILMAGVSGSPLYISHDNGNTVEALSFTVSGADPVLNYCNNRLCIIGSDKIWVSIDEGYSWDTISVDVTDYFRMFDFVSDDEAMVACGYGYPNIKTCGSFPEVYISYDEGQNWTNINENLEQCGAYTFGPVHLSGRRIIMGSDYNGLWYRDDLLTGDDEEISEEGPVIKVFPNPAKTSFSIKIESQEKHVTGIVTIRSLTGQIVVQGENIVFENGKTTHPIDVSNLGPGLYLVSLLSETGTPLYGKLLKP